MGIIRVTAYPSRYAFAEDSVEAEALDKEPLEQPMGRMYIRFMMKSFTWNERIAQREIAKALGKAMGSKPTYHRGTEHNCYDYGHYEVGGWDIEGYCVTSAWFELDHVQEILDVLGSLDGYAPDGDISIFLVPERYDVAMVYNAYTIIEARKKLIAKALSFEDDFMFIIGQHPTFSIPLDVFDLPVIEACVFLYHQIAQMAWTTKQARMKPCDMSNPKYHMRTWLLRLGFIGPQFERPRQTLLARLSGDTAFFNEEQKKQAVARRKAKRLNGGVTNEGISESV